MSASQIPEVHRYILNQEAHHRKMSFQEELKELLKRHGVEYEEDDFEDPGSRD